MALVLKDRVKESSASSGTGSITLGGAFPGYQTFSASIASGSTVYYTIHNLVPGFDTEWEVGVGTFTSPSTLSRNTILSSSTGSAVNFTAGTEGLEVFVTQPAEEAVYINQATGKVEVGGNGTNSVSFTTIVANTATLTDGTVSATPANATDIVNKSYVDNIVAAGVHYHEPVFVESPTPLNAVYVQPNGAGNGVGATLTNNGANAALVIDGVSVSNTARVLVYTQSNAVQNGIYTVTNPGNSTAQWVLTRATDADTYVIDSPNGLSEGSTVYVQSGNTGAGETYTCNTQGTITFGSTNISFAQISSAQVYSAGTGLNLTNLSFNISNTTVVSGLYGDSANVAVIEVNAQGQLTSAANSAINVSNITVGTLANDRTTASASNGANTIVSRDANGSFTANVVTATTVNATTGNFTNVTANAAGLTDINASNITSGTISNARTTGSTSNSASTIVLRDASGNFGSNVITASSFSGDGTAITAINASNISSGTIANARTTAASANGASTIVQRDSGGNFSANTITANISGDISGGTNINASNITSGTISNARTTAASANGASTIVLRDTNGSFDANVVNATNLSGGGTSITSVNASNLSAGTVASARISGSYTGITGVGTVTAGTWQGNAVGVSYGGTGTSTQFTAGSVVFAGASGVYTQNNANFFWDNTNARLGVGTTSPINVLQVKKDQTADTAIVVSNTGTANAATTMSFVLAESTTPQGWFRRYRDGTGITEIGYTDTLTFSGNVTGTKAERMRIDADGDVGIGTSSPTGRLNVVSTASTTNTALKIESSGTLANNDVVRLQINGVTNGFRMFQDASSNVRYSFEGGNVGIGTTTPGTALEVNGTVTATTFSGAGTNLTGTASSLTAGTATNWGSYGAVPAAGTSFGTANTIGRSDANGYTYFNYINSNTAASENPTIGQVIVTNNSDNNFYRKASIAHLTSSLSGTAPINISGTATTATTANALNTGNNYQVNSLGVGTAASGTAGEIRATNNITAYYSDERLKTKTGDIENALTKVCQIETMLYHANETAVALGYDASIIEPGVTAQSVQKVQPEVVVPAPIDEKYLTVRYEKLVPLLIEAIKELKAEVDALKGK